MNTVTILKNETVTYSNKKTKQQVVIKNKNDKNFPHMWMKKITLVFNITIF